mgnify:CR=1 FL=1
MKKISYLDGVRLFRAVKAGCLKIISEQDELNRINVFPIADADTGYNLAYTCKSIIDKSNLYEKMNKTLSSIAEAAFAGARGNSGIIFAQFFQGINLEIIKNRLTTDEFITILKKAIQHVYESMANPVEGTILTVMREWCEQFEKEVKHSKDFYTSFLNTFEKAKESLLSTKKYLEILAKNDVVDAGALGFVYFLEGIKNFILKGEIQKNNLNISLNLKKQKRLHSVEDIKFRYCTEADLYNTDFNQKQLLDKLADYGDSIIAGQVRDYFHFHIHTNHPEKIFQDFAPNNTFSAVKVDDMVVEQKINNNPPEISVIVDSSCDLPEAILDKFNIFRIPLNIYFNDEEYLDKLTINSQIFYDKINNNSIFPRTSQPSMKNVKKIYDLAIANSKYVIGIHLSAKLSGTFEQIQAVYSNNENLCILDSKHLSGSYGLIVYRIVQELKEYGFQAIKKRFEKYRENTKILTDIKSLDYLVRGGRVKPLIGKAAKLVNLKPIVSVDKIGKALLIGKSFTRNGNLKKILKIFKQDRDNNGIWNYAIVHGNNLRRAKLYAELLTDALNKKPLYISEIAPSIAVHNGEGAVAVCYMTKNID